VAKDKEDFAAAAAEEKADELAILKESLDQAKAQSADYYDQLLRLKAEFENFRKRTERERAEAHRRGKEDVILQLVSLMDVLEQAEKAAHTAPDLKAMVVGMDLLYGEFRKLLKSQGIEEIGTEGGAFNPSEHEAVETVDDEGEENRVVAVLQKGYRLKEVLLRPARVKVSRKPAAKKENGESRFDSEGGARYREADQ
jgi:molecular chaperone GrpE